MQDSCNLDTNENTPSDRNIDFSLTLSTSERHQPSAAGFSVRNVIGIFQALQNHRTEVSYDEQKTIHLPPEKYPQLVKALECDQIPQEYVNDKVRYVPCQ
jgi:hypothetical protein